MHKYLITGGAGFIGSSIAEHLVREGNFVRVLDNFSSGKEENLDFSKGLGKDKFELLCGDITTARRLPKGMPGHGLCPSSGGVALVPQSLHDPLSYDRVNIDGILHMLKQRLNIRSEDSFLPHRVQFTGIPRISRKKKNTCRCSFPLMRLAN